MIHKQKVDVARIYDKKTGMYTVECIACGKAIKTYSPRKMYCSNSCKPRNIKSYLFDNTEMNSAKRGATSEMYVCADLLRRGCEVFRSIAPDGCVDVIAIKRESGNVYFIESRTASVNTYNGKVYAMMNTHVDKVSNMNVVVAAVSGPDNIQYLDRNEKIVDIV